MRRTVLLTGFAGFIGSQILRDLTEQGYFVIGIDNMSEGSNPNNIRDVTDNFFPIFADIADKKLESYLAAGAETIDYVINCAAQSHVDRSFSEYGKFIRSNVTGPVNLANIALKYKVKKFVQVSTDEVFGGSAQPFTEESLITPKNAYSSSKASAEFFLKNYEEAFGLPLVITNGANTYGPRQMAEKIIPLTITKLLKGEKVPLYQTPARRMWLHVTDHSSGIIAAMEKGVVGERYCLAPSEGNELYTSDLVKEICGILGKSFEECVQMVPDRPNYDLRYYMLNEKAQKDLDWVPVKNIREELANVVSCYS